jgi:glutamyl-tRNA synthetase
MKMLRTRIAPTPSGYLHLGNVVNALLTWAHARAVGGHVTLRIDDLDPQMSRPEYLEDIFRTIDWLGIDIDAGPSSVAEVEQTWSQQHRRAAYDAVLQILVDQGALFACGCTRREIALAGSSGVYPGTCRDRRIPLDATDVSWRLLDDSVALLPFPIVRLKNGLPAYHIASITDDVQMGITWILRGEDLEPSSHIQYVIASRVPDLAPFGRVHIRHHPLIVDEHGEKLSKSRGATDVRHLRDKPYGLQDVLDAVTKFHGCPPVLRVSELPSVVSF